MARILLTNHANIQEATVVTDYPGNLPPAGWYPDPYGAPYERWWDGAQWTDHTNTPAAPEPVAAAAEPAPVEPAAAEPITAQPVAASYQQTSEPAYEAPAAERYPEQIYRAPSQVAEPAQVSEPAQVVEPAQSPEPAEPYKSPAPGQSAWNTPASAASSFDDIFATGQAPQQPAAAQTGQPAFTQGTDTFTGQPQSAQSQSTQPQSTQPQSYQPQSYQTAQPAYEPYAAQPAQSAQPQSQPQSQSFLPTPASGGDDFGQLIAGGGAGGASDPYDSWSNQDYEEPARNTMATVGLTFGVLSFVIPALAGLVGIITSALGLVRSSRFQREEGVALGRGKSIAGIALSVIGSAASIAVVLFVLPGLINPVDAGGDDDASGLVANVPKTDFGNIAMEPGATGTINFAGTTDPSIQFTVTGITPDPACTEDPALVLSPENGQFVALTMEFTTAAEYSSAMTSGGLLQISSADFVGLLADGSAVVNTTAGTSCVPEAEQLPAEIPAGSTVTGTVILDLSPETASFSFAPAGVTGLDPATRWEWAIPR